MTDNTMVGAGNSLWPLVHSLRRDAIFTDLTHSFAPGQPRFPTLPDEVRTIYSSHQDNDVLIHRYEFAGQWGTHVDPPNHYIADGRSLDEIPVTDMLCPLVILDISKRVLANADAVPSLEDIKRYEAKWGPIPAGAFVALRTDWYRRWPNIEHFQNRDSAGIAHCPGWSLPVLSFLLEERAIVAIGHETLDTDPGVAWSRGDTSLERYLLKNNRWQIEALAHLDQIPEHGAVIMASWPKPKGGSGFPARAVAIHCLPLHTNQAFEIQR